MSNIITSTELIMNMKKTPDEDSQEFFDFWKNERDKCKNGIIIDGTFISGFLYYHLNFFKCQLDIPENGKVIRKLSNPYLRDNEWIIDGYIRQAEEQKKGLCILGSRRLAKALRNDELLYTETGTIPIGLAKEGDKIYDPSGNLTTIVGVFPQGKIPVYKLELQDGRIIHCCENHIWTVLDKRNKTIKNLTTKQLIPIYKRDRIHNGYKDKTTRNIEECFFAIPNNSAVEYGEKDLEIDPYYLGLWLGDGNSRNTGITSIDNDIISYIQEYANHLNLKFRKDEDTFYIAPSVRGGNKKEIYLRNSLLYNLKSLNLIKNKHIPNKYLHSSVNQRMELLRGMMDTDGSVSTKDGTITYVTTSKFLADGFYTLCRSLGINIRKTKFIPKLDGKECGVGWKFQLYTELPVFKLKRKLDKIRIGVKGKQFKINYTSIKNIELVEEAESTCIMVDNESKLFLTTHFTTTHNSVFEASYITHRATLYKGTQNVISGLNEPDIKVIADLCEEALGNLPQAFKHGRIEDNWKKQVTFGEKTASGDRKPWSSIPIRNLDGGKNTEALAGLSPFSMVIDEIGKGDWLNAFSAAIPGFATPFGWRCSPLAFGTSGDMIKANDAKLVFEAPEAYNFLAVEVPDEPEKKTSVFISGHYAHDFPKDNTPLNEYLNIPKRDAPNLSKINIQVTNIDIADTLIDAEREMAKKSDDSNAVLKITMYHPKNRFELFLQESNNKFNREAIEQQQAWLSNHFEPIYADFYRDMNGKVQWKYSEYRPITKFPVKPSELKYTPVCIYEHPIANAPRFTYCIGIDPINNNDSTDKVVSLFTINVFKRMLSPLDEYKNQIVASYRGRPKELAEAHELALLLAEYYNAIEGVLPEASENSIFQYFFMKRKGHYLANSFDLVSEISKGKSSFKGKKGLPATTTNQRHYMNLMVEYAKEEIISMDDEGEETMAYGVTKIKDPMLLEEMKMYRSKGIGSKGVHDGNFDSIVSFGCVLTLASYYDAKYPIATQIIPKQTDYQPVTKTSIKTPFGTIEKKKQGLSLSGDKPKITLPRWMR